MVRRILASLIQVCITLNYFIRILVLNYYIEHADELTDTLVLRIINYLIEQVGPFPMMHDELLSQMCKQTVKNPDPFDFFFFSFLFLLLFLRNPQTPKPCASVVCVVCD